MNNCNIDWANWIQAIASLSAVGGLIYTLLLQQKTLKEQQKITSLEYQKYINSYLPILEIEDFGYYKYQQKRAIKFNIVIKDNYLQRLIIEHNFPEHFDVGLPHLVENVILSKGYKLSFSVEHTLSPVFIEIEEYSGNTIDFKFEDALGNKYIQQLVYKGNVNIFLHPAYRI